MSNQNRSELGKGEERERGTSEEKGGTKEKAAASEETVSPDLQRSKRIAQNQKFDVFLSYAEEDKEFAEEMRLRLMNHAKLKIFVPSDGKCNSS